MEFRLNLHFEVSSEYFLIVITTIMINSSFYHSDKGYWCFHRKTLPRLCTLVPRVMSTLLQRPLIRGTTRLSITTSRQQRRQRYHQPSAKRIVTWPNCCGDKQLRWVLHDRMYRPQEDLTLWRCLMLHLMRKVCSVMFFPSTVSCYIISNRFWRLYISSKTFKPIFKHYKMKVEDYCSDYLQCFNKNKFWVSSLK